MSETKRQAVARVATEDWRATKLSMAHLKIGDAATPLSLADHVKRSLVGVVDDPAPVVTAPVVSAPVVTLTSADEIPDASDATEPETKAQAIARLSAQSAAVNAQLAAVAAQ